MISVIYVEREINKLGRLYLQASSGSDVYLPKLYSKLSVLELCGWTEECMDSLISGQIKRKRLRETRNIDYINNIVIKRTWGFKYEDHFRKMLIQTIGISKLEWIEKKMNQNKKTSLEAALTKLYPERDSHAHTTVRTAKIFTAPSVCIVLLKNIKEGLFEYEKWLKKI